MDRTSLCIRHIAYLACIFLLTSCGISKSLKDQPDVSSYNANIGERTKINDSTFVIGDNFLTKNEQGLWELYVEGDPLELGLLTGQLTQELFQKQEDVFLSKVEELVPSKTKQAVLRKFLAWFNRKVYLHVPEEYKAEIYGLSKYASERYDHIAPSYLRVLYLHGAHDIGHALQDLALVGCSSFAAWGDKTEDGNLIIGRNFDFYAGDAFAEEKIIAFVNPSEGHKFMSVTWGGMIGVVSGMNDQGLTVTINAGKSKVPLVAKTPISLVTREILQYASTVDEAIAIAKKRDVFVSESIFVGSAKDKKAIIIEKSPGNFGVFEVPNSNQLICSNHFQSNAFVNDKRNIKHIEESHSKYRYLRMQELLAESPKVTPTSAVDILRNTKGLEDKEIGFGNEKALNQLLAHHGIVFKPDELLVWVSSSPYQLGEFVTYDLNTVFDETSDKVLKTSVSNAQLNIAEDPFIHSIDFKNYEAYRMLERNMEQALASNQTVSPNIIYKLQRYNPNYWKGHYLVGAYYYNKKYYTAALGAFQEAAAKEITTAPDREKVAKYIRKLNRKLNK